MSRFNLQFIGFFLLLISLFSFLNIIYSYYFNTFLNINVYLYTLIISLLVGLFLFFYKKYNFVKINIFQKIITVFVGYIFLPVIISIPYYFSIDNISYINSLERF